MAQANLLFGRSSSHFTRVARIFAAELAVPYALEIVRDLNSLIPEHYGSNPALKIPVLKSAAGVWFGSLPVSQELARQAPHALRIVWPHDLTDNLSINAQELVLTAMATEVSIILAKRALGDASANQRAHLDKMQTSLEGVLRWLERNVEAALEQLPPRDISFLEVTLFCLVSHLPFREVMDTKAYSRLTHFVERFSARESVQKTQYVFDL